MRHPKIAWAVSDLLDDDQYFAHQINIPENPESQVRLLESVLLPMPISGG